MFDKLFRRSRTQIDADASKSFDEGHGTIAAAPNAHELLRSNEEQSNEQHASQAYAANSNKPVDEGLHAQQQARSHASDAYGLPQPASTASTKQPSARRAAMQLPADEAQQELGQRTAQQAAPRKSTTAVIQQQQADNSEGYDGLPALCQVAPAADHAHLQEQHNSVAQRGVQPSTTKQTGTAQHAPLQAQYGQQLPVAGSSWQQQQNHAWTAPSLVPVSYGSLLQQQVPQTVEALQQQLLLEAKAREELEDMLLRYERHLQGEAAARLAAEQQTEAAMLHANDVRQQLASNGRQAKQQDDELAARAALQQERAELEQMRMEFDAQLHAARNEVAKAQASMSSNEDRIRTVGAEERAQIVSEYEMRLSAMMAEVERLREELVNRTHLMTAEMERWKRQATFNAAAVIEAKNEVMDRKRELDSTKDKMDHLIEKLYAGREGNVSLSGAIAAAANFQQVSTSHFLQQQANSMSSYAGGRSSMAGSGTASMLLPQSGLAGRGPSLFADDNTGLISSTSSLQKPANPHSRADSKALVPTMQQTAFASKRQTAAPSPGYSVHQNSSTVSKFPPPPLILSGAGGMPQPQQWQHKPSATLPGRPPHLQHLPTSPRSRSSRIPQPFLTAAAASNPSSPASTQHLPAVTSRSAGQQQRARSTSRSKVGKREAGSYAHLHQQQHLASAGEALSPAGTAGGDAFGHVISRYAQSAMKYSQVQQTKAKKQQTQQTKKQQLPDRFAEGAKNAAMITAMANKFG